MTRPTAVRRMREDAKAYMDSVVKITRDSSDPDDWTVDDATGDLTRPDVEEVYEGPAIIAANEQRYSEGSVDRLFVRLPGETNGIARSDILEVLQTPLDLTLIQASNWLVLDVDMGTHHVTRRLECVSRLRPVALTPGPLLDER